MTRRVALSVLGSGALGCGALSAQTLDRTKPPEPSAPRPCKLPPLFETRLPNGLTVLLVEDGRLPLVTVRLAFRCGNRRDPKNLPGVAAAVAELMTVATTTRGSIQIVEAVDTMGGSLSASAGADHLSVNGAIEPDSLPGLLEIMADVARNADFSDIDLRLYKQSRKLTLARQYTQSSFAAGYVLRQTLFGDHPYARIAPTPGSLDALKRVDLLDYRDKWLAPNNAFLIMLGRIPARADAVKMITERLGAWDQKVLPEAKPEPLPKPAKKLILFDNPGAAQVEVRLGKIAATQRDADYFAELVGLTIAGGVPVSPDVRIEHAAFDEAGYLSASLQVSNAAAGEALQGMLTRLDRIAAGPITGKELADAKGFAEGRFLLQLETQAGLADELMVEKIQGLPANYLELWRTRMEAVKPEEVQAAAQKYLSTQDSVIVVVGDASKIQESLGKVGKFEVMKGGK